MFFDYSANIALWLLEFAKNNFSIENFLKNIFF